MSGRNSQVARIYTLLQVLEGAPQGLSVKELMDRVVDRGHEVKQRTIYRDLEALQQAGFPLSCEDNATDSNASRWTLERLTRVNEHFILSTRELLALFLARGVLAPLRDTPFYVDLNSIFKKIEERVGPKGREYFQELSGEMHFEPGPRWGLGLDPVLLETVQACCAERQVLEVRYSSANSGDKRVRKLGPHYLLFAKGSVYLIAEDLRLKR